MDSTRPVVLVLMGGPDAEHDVSLMSGTEVASALRRGEAFNVVEEVIIEPSGEELAEMIESCRADVVFPVLHGRWGEGGGLQELLEEIGHPYVGSRPHAAQLAMNKLATKSLLAAAGVPTPPAYQIGKDDECTLDLPLVLKPIDDGSSVDLRICTTPAELDAARIALHRDRAHLMAEAFIAGRELTVGIVCGEVLPLIEIIPATEFYDYEAKYERDDTRYVVNPDLPEHILTACKEYTMLAYRRVGCRDVARVDFMLDERGPWLLEVNTMPGFTTHSLVPMAAAATGRDMSGLCTMLAETALARADVSPRPETPIS